MTLATKVRILPLEQMKEMLKEVAISFVIKRLWRLVRTHGMKLILQALIEMTDESNEDYLRQLNRDLRTALKNYEDRHK